MLVQTRLPLFPITTKISTNKDQPSRAILSIAGCDLEALAAEYGTPLYLYDQATLDDAVQQYRSALAKHYPGESAITFAGKAWMCLAAAQWTQRHNLVLDCTGAGEIYIANEADVPMHNLLVHGVNKSFEDLQAALQHAGIIVIDNLTELRQIIQMIQPAVAKVLTFWLRIRPGVAVDTHAYRQTGQEDSKFGMSLAEAVEAVELCRKHDLQLTGLHFHQGSHFHDPGPIAPAVEIVLDLIAALQVRSGWLPQILSPGGGWGIAYHEDDLPHATIDTYVAFISQALVAGCQQRNLPLPRLQVEPGRSLVGRAGVALYRVGAVKQSAQRRWVMIDGGMADNPRPALYKARYSALPVAEVDRPATGPAWLGGPFCESGDVLIEALPLPDIQPGEILAVPVTGAYQLNMGSNYNGALRPAVLWLHHGQARLIQRRESLASLIGRDLSLA